MVLKILILVLMTLQLWAFETNIHGIVRDETTHLSYFDLQWVFNGDNIWDIQRKTDDTKSKVHQGKVFPIGGFTLEF